MENQVFVILKDWYEMHQQILSAGEILKRLGTACSGEYLVEGVYVFNAWLDGLRKGTL